jgi:hypothetical protein
MELDRAALNLLVDYMFCDEERDYFERFEDKEINCYDDFMQQYDIGHIFIAHWKLKSYLEGWTQEESNKELYNLYNEYFLTDSS